MPGKILPFDAYELMIKECLGLKKDHEVCISCKVLDLLLQD